MDELLLVVFQGVFSSFRPDRIGYLAIGGGIVASVWLYRQNEYKHQKNSSKIANVTTIVNENRARIDGLDRQLKIAESLELTMREIKEDLKHFMRQQSTHGERIERLAGAMEALNKNVRP